MFLVLVYRIHGDETGTELPLSTPTRTTNRFSRIRNPLRRCAAKRRTTGNSAPSTIFLKCGPSENVNSSEPAQPGECPNSCDRLGLGASPRRRHRLDGKCSGKLDGRKPNDCRGCLPNRSRVTTPHLKALEQLIFGDGHNILWDWRIHK